MQAKTPPPFDLKAVKSKDVTSAAKRLKCSAQSPVLKSRINTSTLSSSGQRRPSNVTNVAPQLATRSNQPRAHSGKSNSIATTQPNREHPSHTRLIPPQTTTAPPKSTVAVSQPSSVIEAKQVPNSCEPDIDSLKTRNPAGHSDLTAPVGLPASSAPSLDASPQQQNPPHTVTLLQTPLPRLLPLNTARPNAPAHEMPFTDSLLHHTPALNALQRLEPVLPQHTPKPNAVECHSPFPQALLPSPHITQQHAPKLNTQMLSFPFPATTTAHTPSARLLLPPGVNFQAQQRPSPTFDLKPPLAFPTYHPLQLTPVPETPLPLHSSLYTSLGAAPLQFGQFSYPLYPFAPYPRN
jgi:hypothetical protein